MKSLMSSLILGALFALNVHAETIFKTIPEKVQFSSKRKVSRYISTSFTKLPDGSYGIKVSVPYRRGHASKGYKVFKLEIADHKIEREGNELVIYTSSLGRQVVASKARFGGWNNSKGVELTSGMKRFPNMMSERLVFEPKLIIK